MLQSDYGKPALKVGISQKKLGILAGLDEHSASARMNQYEIGKPVPNVLILQHIGKVLGCPVAFFYADDDIIAEIILLMTKLSTLNKRDINGNSFHSIS